MAERKTRALFEEAGATARQTAPSAAPGAAERDRAAGRSRLMLWQFAIAVLVGVMVLVGGMTRLTDSGLSITEWNLVTGILPPLSAEGWQAEFAKYQTIPEFREINPDMTLAEFKPIYWWEWGHRFLGRIVGLAYLLPFLWFWLKGAIPPGWTARLFIPGVLIAVQGAIGWWMVTSGLTARVDVAPYRLAVHLGLAFVIFYLVVWNGLALGRSAAELLAARRRRFRSLLGFAGGVTAVLFAQIVVGAMVAGYDAGRGYTDWPLMQGSFLPPHDTAEAIWQFTHRMLGYLVVALLAFFWWKARASGHRRVAFWAGIAALGGLAQMLWGIVTLVNGAAWGYAIFHQIGALVLLFVLLRAKFEIAYPAEQRIERA